MKNDKAFSLAIALIALCFFVGGTAAADQGRQLSGEAYFYAGNSPSFANVGAVEATGSDDAEFLPCGRFPKESVFDNFEKAFLTPEKVRCLSPSLEGEDLNMTRLPSQIGTLINLEVLSFACLEELLELPEEIGNLSKLEELIIDNGNGCSMSISLPRSIGKLKKLRILRLYGAIEPRDERKTESLPETIAELRGLEVLDLGRNGLDAVPPQIAALPNLKTLRLEYNNLSVLPEFVGSFKKLKELSLNSNGKLSDLPAPLAKLKGLKVAMGNNSLKLADQKRLRTRFPGIVFYFQNEFDDESANEEAPKPKPKSRRKR